jgi:hypothetical protein
LPLSLPVATFCYCRDWWVEASRKAMIRLTARNDTKLVIGLLFLGLFTPIAVAAYCWALLHFFG